MPESAVLLYRVLVEEYEHLGAEPPFPRQEFEREFARQLPALEAKLELTSQRTSDPEAYDRKLDAEKVKEFYAWLHANAAPRSALCLSGGGIRSATFGLGIVQGLARHGLLKQLDYLSTVSGGGYLGSWLSAWVYRVRQRLAAADPRQALRPEDSLKALLEVEAELRDRPASPLEPGPEPLQYLRSYSRYMSPRLGLLSADTWTLVAIFFRNLVLNWLVLLPLLAAALVIPRVSVILVRLGTRPWFQAEEGTVLPVVFWAAVLLGSCAIGYIIANRPSLGERSVYPPRLRTQEWFLALCLLPLGLMAILITLYWAWIRSRGTPLAGLRFVILGLETSPLLAFTLFGILLHLGGFVFSRIWVRRRVLGELLVTVATGAVGGALCWLAARNLFPTIEAGLSSALYVCFAAPLLLFLFLLATVLFVGLASHYTDDSDREWLARCGAWVLIAIAARLAFSAVVIFGPVAVLRATAWVTSIGGISGLVTLLLGRSSKTKAKDGQQKQDTTSRLLDKAVAAAGPLFAVFILIVLAMGTSLLIRWLTATFLPDSLPGSNLPGPPWPPLPGVSPHFWWEPLSVVYFAPWKPVLGVLVLLALAGWLMGWFVDINRFSLHCAYRDRLIRAYLGASRGGRRRPNPFTGFDEDDNVELYRLRGNRPFHVVGITLNLVAGRNLAWQDRLAETFTASPLHAGSFRLGYRSTMEYGKHRKRNVRLSLGTAMAISGAAASPNMGYQSSPVVTFLLALWNVRLGWWLGNPGPAGDRTYATEGPRFAPASLFAEAFGLTDSEHPYVYLSDGGHFENLGLYEMVLRRCHFIVVSDAGQDPKFGYEDLGNALSKIRVDLGVPIRFEKILIPPLPREGDRTQESYDAGRRRGNGGSLPPYCALARICYSCVDSAAGGKTVKDGFLLYIKPSRNGTEPADVFHYARLHPLFPHEPTADQLYTESQFESYRELGSHAMRTILENVPVGATLETLFEQVEAELGTPPACD
ncbi:MAG: patatin-like phospholipase family protein [Acidobacteriota bacterium]|nr:patatin-like phospholipase family protein [Acidobacteriota bacterium]